MSDRGNRWNDFEVGDMDMGGPGGMRGGPGGFGRKTDRKGKTKKGGLKIAN